MTPKKKTIERKRTTFPREVLCTQNFVDCWENLEHSGRHDMNLIKEAIALLVKHVSIPSEWRDPQLKGEWKDFRECHVKGDLLLVYRILKKSYCEVAVFSYVGTHSEIFG